MMVKTVKLEELTQYQTYHIENKYCATRELSEKTGTVVRTCKIMDLDGLGVRHLNRAGLRYFRTQIQFTQDNYPEMLGTLFVVNVPWVFKTVWKIVKPWLSEFTVQKIQILEGDYKTVLLKQIAPEHLPKIYGGTCECAGGCVVELDPNEGMTQVTIAARASHVVKFEADDPSCIVSWEFRTTSHNLAMQAEFIPKDKPEQKTVVVPLNRFETGSETTGGSYEPKAVGTVVLTFDNEFSVMTSKILYYRIQKSKSESAMVAELSALSPTDKEPSA